jgi:hypothetical protein
MIVKDSQLQQQVPDRTEWPLTLTPEQREQLLREKIARAIRAHQQRYEYTDWNQTTNQFSVIKPTPCEHESECINITIKDIIVPLMNLTNFFVEFPES